MTIAMVYAEKCRTMDATRMRITLNQRKNVTKHALNGMRNTKAMTMAHHTNTQMTAIMNIKMDMSMDMNTITIIK